MTSQVVLTPEPSKTITMTLPKVHGATGYNVYSSPTIASYEEALRAFLKLQARTLKRAEKTLRKVFKIADGCQLEHLAWPGNLGGPYYQLLLEKPTKSLEALEKKLTRVADKLDVPYLFQELNAEQTGPVPGGQYRMYLFSPAGRPWPGSKIPVRPEAYYGKIGFTGMRFVLTVCGDPEYPCIFLDSYMAPSWKFKNDAQKDGTVPELRPTMMFRANKAGCMVQVDPRPASPDPAVPGTLNGNATYKMTWVPQ